MLDDREMPTALCKGFEKGRQVSAVRMGIVIELRSNKGAINGESGNMMITSKWLKGEGNESDI